MNAQAKFVFVNAKRKLVQTIIERAEAQILSMLFEHLANAGIESRPQKEVEQACRQIDQKLEQLIVEWVLEEDEAELRAQLKMQFGFSSFGEEPQKTLKRILRKQRIQSEDDAKLVQDFLSGSYLGWDADEKKLRKLSEILGAYERPA